MLTRQYWILKYKMIFRMFAKLNQLLNTMTSHNNNNSNNNNHQFMAFLHLALLAGDQVLWWNLLSSHHQASSHNQASISTLLEAVLIQACVQFLIINKARIPIATAYQFWFLPWLRNQKIWLIVIFWTFFHLLKDYLSQQKKKLIQRKLSSVK